MGWLGGVTVTGGTSNTNSNQNVYGTHTPNVSDQYTAAYKGLSGNVNAQGADPLQQQGIGFMQGQMDPTKNPVNAAATGQNNFLWDLDKQYANVNNLLYGLADQPVRQAQAYTSAAPMAQAYTATAAQTAPVGEAHWMTGAGAAQPYASLYGSQVTQPALDAYDYGTARGLSALDARIAGSSGFANSRSEIPYGDLITQAAQGRARLVSDLNTQGLINAFGFGQQDANRATQNSQFNKSLEQSDRHLDAANQQQANLFNASALNDNSRFNTTNQTQNNQFNASQQQNNSQFNVNAGYTGDRNRAAVLQQVTSNLQSRSGLGQQALQNIITANGINTEAAQALFAQGSITQSQLNDILAAAAQYNGYSYTQDTTGSSATNQIGFKASTPGGGG